MKQSLESYHNLMNITYETSMHIMKSNQERILWKAITLSKTHNCTMWPPVVNPILHTHSESPMIWHLTQFDNDLTVIHHWIEV